MRQSVRIRVGEERYVVSMFVDMRRSTALAEARLPFDTMFIINRFVAAVSSAVEDAGGRPNQFVGDGILALFGLDASPSIACSQAINSIGKIAANVAQLNRDLAGDLREPIQYGIGLNGGNVIIGDIGYREHIVFTALGDPVNVGGASAGHDQDLWVRCAHRRGDLPHGRACARRVVDTGDIDSRPRPADDGSSRGTGKPDCCRDRV